MLVAAALTVFAGGVPSAGQAEEIRNRGYGFYGFGLSGNLSGHVIEVGQQALPQATLEYGYPFTHRLSAGFEISALFYRNRTQRWGGEFNFGAALGTQVSLTVSKRWFLTAGGGWVLSNPLSDSANGEYAEGYEGNPDAQIVREPIQRVYARFTVGRRFGEHWAAQAGTRNLSPYVAIGFAPQ